MKQAKLLGFKVRKLKTPSLKVPRIPKPKLPKLTTKIPRRTPKKAKFTFKIKLPRFSKKGGVKW